MRIQSDEMASQRRARETLDFGLASRGRQRTARCRAENFAVVLVGDDDSATVGPKLGPVEAFAVELRRQAPVVPIAEVEIVGPFAMPQQGRARTLVLALHNMSSRIDAYQV